MTNTKLAQALAQFEAALLFAYPEGARGAAFDCWNAARQALAAYDAEQAAMRDLECPPDPETVERELAAQAVPAVRVADVGFRWDGEKQQHVPTLLVEFEPVPANSGSDAKGWRDRDAMAAMLAAAPTPPAPEAQQAAGQEQDERDAFEAWATEYSTIPLERDDDDGLGTTGYTVMEQTMLWDAWQAAMAHAREAVESVPVPRIWGIANSRHAWIIAQAFDDYRAAVLRALVETK